MAQGLNVPPISYDSDGQLLLNVILALIVFGIALDLKPSDFARVARDPRGVLTGVVAQFAVLPALTCLLVFWLPIPAGFALGMLLVSCCPGGSLSNFVTHFGKGDTALSVSMTAVSSCLAVFLLPLNFSFWASVNPRTLEALRAIDIDAVAFLLNLVAILALPLAAGLILGVWRPGLARRAHLPFRWFSLLALVAFITVAFTRNAEAFAAFALLIAGLVALHNALALASGYVAATLVRLGVAQRRAVTVEVGMQNSGLGLAIIFGFFGGQPQMALIAAWWGVWHVISGLSIALIWRRIDGGSPLNETPEVDRG